MRLVDVTIPKLGDDDPSAPATTSNYQMPSGLFPFAGEEYTVDDDHDHEEGGVREHTHGDDEAAEVCIPCKDIADVIVLTKISQLRAMHQRSFELNFAVDTLRASIFKSQPDGEKPLGDVSFNQFALTFGLEKYDMTVDINLG